MILSTSAKLSPLLFLAACAGNAPAEATPPAPASAPAAIASAPVPAVSATAAPSASARAPASAEPSVTASAAPSVTASAAPSVIVALTAGPEAAPPPTATASEDAPPPLSATQKAFVTGQLLGTQVVFVTVVDAPASCESVTSKDPPAKGARRADLRVLWLSGYYDFSNRMAEGKLGTYQGSFWLKEDATQGGITIRSAPQKKGETGRLHLKAARPGSAQTFDAELDVTVCAALDFSKVKR